MAAAKDIQGHFISNQYTYQFVRLYVRMSHRHLSNIDCLMAHTVSLVCFINTVNSRNKKKRNESQKCLGKCGTSSGNITKVEQSIFFRYLWYECF
jgi:hypothetical protein